MVNLCEGIEFDSKGNPYTTDEATVSPQQTEQIQKCAVAMNEVNALLYNEIDKDGAMKNIKERASKASNDIDTCRKGKAYSELL